MRVEHVACRLERGHVASVQVLQAETQKIALGRRVRLGRLHEAGLEHMLHGLLDPRVLENTRLQRAERLAHGYGLALVLRVNEQLLHLHIEVP
jgi:hypothetical protein